MSIAVEVAPGDAGPESGETFPKQRLAFEFVEGILHMRVSQELADILKDGFWRRAWLRRRPGGQCRRFVQFVNPIGPGSGQHAAFTAAPDNFERQLVG